MVKKAVYLFLILCHVLVHQVYANKQKVIDFVHLNEDDGLSSNDVNCIFKDSRGFLWFGTRNGLNRYDAYEFEVWKHIPGDSTGISNNTISCINEDGEGNIWVGTRHGINKYNYESGSFQQFHAISPDGLSDNNIKCLEKDSKGIIWIGTSNGLNRVSDNHEEIHQVGLKNCVADSSISIISIEVDHVGKLWLGTFSNGLIEYDPYSGVCKKICTEEYKFSQAKSLFYSMDSMLYIGTNLHGILVYNPREEKLTHCSIKGIHKNNLSSVHDITGDSNGNLWVSQGHVFYKLNSKTKITRKFEYDPESTNGRSMGIVADILCDGFNRVWFAYGASGINLYDRNRKLFQSYYVPINVRENKNDFVRDIFTDAYDNTWIGTFGNGVKTYNSKFEMIGDFNTLNSPLPNDFVTSMFITRENIIWIGTLRGLITYDIENNQWGKKTTTADGLWYNTITEIYQDSDKNIWIATQEGLNKYYPPTQEYLKIYPSDGLVHYKITDIIEDDHGSVWFSSYKGISIYSLEKKDFAQFIENGKSDLELSDNFIWCLMKDNGGNIWIGTANGLNMYDYKSKEIIWYFEKDGLSSNVITSLQLDLNNNIWILTPSGVSVYDLDEKNFELYNQFDGLSVNYKAVHLDRRGNLYFGGQNAGFYVFNPESLAFNEEVPPVYITGVGSISDEYKAVPTKKTIEYPYNKRNIKLKFTSLNYTAPEKNQFAYKLEGFDEKWMYTDSKKREVTYTNLSPGEYEFRVIASNNNDIWNNEGDMVKILIAPPWWRTVYAYFLYILIISSLLYVYNRIKRQKAVLLQNIRTEKQKAKLQYEQDQLKLKFFTNISHEFRTPLTLIMGLMDQLISKVEVPKPLYEKMIMVFKNAKRMNNLIDQLIELRKIELGKEVPVYKQDDIVFFSKNIYSSFKHLAETYKIDYIFNCEIEHYTCLFDTYKLETVIMNILSNAFKFTPNHGKISLYLKVLENGPDFTPEEDDKFERSHIYLKISNTGKQINKEELNKIFERFYQSENLVENKQKGSGIGLSLSKDMIGILKGKITVDSNDQGVTAFYIHVPIPREELVEVGNNTENYRVNEIMEPHEYQGEESEGDFNRIERKTPQANDKPILLIVEDNADVRSFFASLFEEKLLVIEAENGNKGYKKALKYIPDIIISDIMMPDEDGINFCKKVKHDERTNHIPFIFLTAKSADEYKIEGFQTGADDYIVKPFNTYVLKARVQNLLKNKNLLKEYYKKYYLYGEDLNENSGNSGHVSVNQRFIKKVKETINQNLHKEDYSVERLAEELEISRSQLNRKLQMILDLSPSELIKICRLKRAMQILRGKNNHSIAETAFMVGFKEASYFSKAFKEHFGKSPSEVLY